MNGLRNCDLAGCGGNFVAIDGDWLAQPYQGSIRQQITGLIPGDTYDISFDWGGAQQTPRNNPPGVDLQFQLLVGLCGSGETPGPTAGFGAPGAHGTCGFYTPMLTTGNHGFTGWHPDSLTIKATQSSETLSFLALGAPAGGGLPPIVLLDGVSASTEVPAPEPATWSLLLIGFAIVGLAWRRPKWFGVPA